MRESNNKEERKEIDQTLETGILTKVQLVSYEL